MECDTQKRINLGASQPQAVKEGIPRSTLPECLVTTWQANRIFSIHLNLIPPFCSDETNQL